MKTKEELNVSALNEVTGGYGLEMETYQEYCKECGYVFCEKKSPKGMEYYWGSTVSYFCPQCQKYVEVGVRIF